MAMQLVRHGGLCCGIKTIYGFPAAPASMVSALSAYDQTGPRETHISYDGTLDCGGRRWYAPAAPSETGLERLDRYLSYADGMRKKQLIEVTLTTAQLAEPGENDCPCSDCRKLRKNANGEKQKHWPEVLAERGFKEVTRFKNSNSGNTVVVFHRNTGEVAKAKPSKSLRAMAEEPDLPEEAVVNALNLTTLAAE